MENCTDTVKTVVSPIFVNQGYSLLLAGLTLGMAGGGGKVSTAPNDNVIQFEMLDPGPVAGDEFSRQVMVLTNGKSVIASEDDDHAGVVDVGSVRLVNGVTGVQIGDSLAGKTIGDFARVAVVGSRAASTFILLAHG